MLPARIQKISIFVFMAALAGVCLCETDTGAAQAAPQTPERPNALNFSEILSDILSVLTILSAPLSRLIQIKKCYDLKSTDGISFTTIVLDYFV